MKGAQFWIIMAVLAFLAWYGVRIFAQSVTDSVTGAVAVSDVTAPA